MTKKIFQLSFLFGAILFLVLLNFHSTQATDCEGQCKALYTDSDQINNCQDTCSTLEKKAKLVKKNIVLNDKTQNILASQLTYLTQQQIKNQQNLQRIQTQLEKLTRKIDKLKTNIKQKEKEINSQKKILVGLMQSYYDYDQQGLLNIVLLKNKLSSFNQTDYLQQSGIKVADVLANIQIIKQQLTKESKDLQINFNKNKTLNNQLKQERNHLIANKNQKQSLLNKTQGDEQKYKAMLANIERQKKQLFNFSSASNLSEIFDSLKNYPTPSKKNRASTSWYFSQRDSRWKNKRIGNSHSLMKDYGCAVTAVSMVFRKLGSSTDPGKMSQAKIFYYDLIEWPRSWSSGINLISSTAHGNINWSTIDSQIKKGHPVIIHIYKTNGRGGHYVVITGKDSKGYIVHDPYFGPNIYLSTSRSLIGKLGIKSGTKLDQMIIYN